jgi:hypothetical protein
VPPIVNLGLFTETTNELYARCPTLRVLPAWSSGQAAQLAAARLRYATHRATFRAAKNRSALTTPVPCALHAQIFFVIDFSLCRSSGRPRRCSLQLQLEPLEAHALPPGARLSLPEAAARHLGCAARPRRRELWAGAKPAAATCRGCPIKLGWSECAQRMVCGEQPQPWAGSVWVFSPRERPSACACCGRRSGDPCG